MKILDYTGFKHFWDKLQTKLDNLSISLSNHGLRLTAFGNRIGALETDVSDLRAQLEEKDTQIAALKTELQKYLPLAGGTMTGNLTVKQAYPSVAFNNLSGNGAYFSLNTAADIVSLNPSGSTQTAAFGADVLRAGTHLTLVNGAQIYDLASGAYIKFDSANKKWVFSHSYGIDLKPVVGTLGEPAAASAADDGLSDQ